MENEEYLGIYANCSVSLLENLCGFDCRIWKGSEIREGPPAAGSSRRRWRRERVGREGVSISSLKDKVSVDETMEISVWHFSMKRIEVLSM